MGALVLLIVIAIIAIIKLVIKALAFSTKAIILSGDAIKNSEDLDEDDPENIPRIIESNNAMSIITMLIIGAIGAVVFIAAMIKAFSHGSFEFWYFMFAMVSVVVFSILALSSASHFDKENKVLQQKYDEYKSKRLQEEERIKKKQREYELEQWRKNKR